MNSVSEQSDENDFSLLTKCRASFLENDLYLPLSNEVFSFSVAIVVEKKTSLSLAINESR
jgi:hypothetical protein